MPLVAASRAYSRNTDWSGKMLPSSPWMSLNCHSRRRGSRAGRRSGRRGGAAGRRCSGRCGRTAGRASACRTRSSPPREVVDHRVPDRAGELEQVRVHVTQRGVGVEVGGAGVVLVEHPARRRIDPQRGVADRAVGRAGQRLEDLQARRPARAARSSGLEEPGEAQRPQLVSSEVGNSGSRTVAFFDTRAGARGRSGPGAGGTRRGSRGREVARSSRELAGNGNQEAKYAGLTHGSHRIEP